MNENLVLTKESVPSDIERYFREVLALDHQEKEFPVNLDDVWQLCYPRKDHAVRELKNNFIEDVDFIVIPKNGEQNSHGGNNRIDYYLTSACLEYFIARKVRPVFEVYRKVFHKVAHNEVKLPTAKELALMVLRAEEEKERLVLENKAQQQQLEMKDAQIVELDTAVNNMKPKVSYVDNILQCKDTINVTQIAQDYGMSAKAFNILLRNLKIQHKVGQIWIVYGKYLAKGYVQSETFTYAKADGTQGVRTFTKWSQRGRLFLYDTLKSHNIIPLIEKNSNDNEQR